MRVRESVWKQGHCVAACRPHNPSHTSFLSPYYISLTSMAAESAHHPGADDHPRAFTRLRCYRWRCASALRSATAARDLNVYTGVGDPPRPILWPWAQTRPGYLQVMSSSTSSFRCTSRRRSQRLRNCCACSIEKLSFMMIFLTHASSESESARATINCCLFKATKISGVIFLAFYYPQAIGPSKKGSSSHSYVW